MPQTPWEEMNDEFDGIATDAIDGQIACDEQDAEAVDAKINAIDIKIAALKAIRARMN